jgi:hypothetical protein
MKTYTIRTHRGGVVVLPESEMIIRVRKEEQGDYFGYVHLHQLEVGDTIEVPGYGMCRQERIEKIEVTRDCICNQPGDEMCPQHGHKRI